MADEDGDSTLRIRVEERPTSARLQLVIVGEATVQNETLDDGRYVLGRSADCDIVVDDQSISRRHLRLDVGPRIVIEDLGSSNGTRVAGARLREKEPVELTPGTSVELGALSMVLQQLWPRLQSRRVWTHDEFEGRLEEECARAARAKSSFGVVRLRSEAPVPDELQIESTIGTTLRGMDVFASYGPNEWEMLILDAQVDEVDAILTRLLASVAQRGTPLRSGVAMFPHHGRSPHELIAKSGMATRGETREEVSHIVLHDHSMAHIHQVVDRIAASKINVLILGETGVGKGVFAERIHQLSPRAKKPFLALNCGAFSPTLLESELFGHEQGSFTGATQAKPGLFESANGGTVFLDEIGELDPSMQVKLLRVLEEGQVRRLGGVRSKSIDVRFLAATNRNLEEDALERGIFRKDLYYRLNGVSLMIPPLRERQGEIEELARAFAADASERGGTGAVSISPEAMDLLLRFQWPGNIRELKNVIERAVLLSLDGVIRPEHLPASKMRARVTRGSSVPPRESASPRPTGETRTVPPAPPKDRDADATVEFKTGDGDDPVEAEKKRIERALAQTGGNQTRAAKLLGISRRTLLNRLDAFGFPRPRKRSKKKP